MNHRLRKLTQIAKHEGAGAALRFLAKDIYFRILASLAFPLGRKQLLKGSGRDPLGEFIGMLGQLPAPRVMEIGSRVVSGSSMRGRFPPATIYTGVDIHAGPGVDVVGDAHELGSMFPAGQFDGVFSISVFEHLVMPWVVALEINKVLKTGGLVLVGTHPTWPPHELPWDFWRYQENAFWALFNQATGFEIICTVTATPARIFPLQRESHLLGTTKTIAPMAIAVLARKTGPFDRRLAWPLTARDVTATAYPASDEKTPSTVPEVTPPAG